MAASICMARRFLPSLGLVTILAALPVAAAVQSQTRASATTVTQGGTWTNSGNAASINGQCALGDGVSSASLRLTGFGFTVPSGATILGVTVQSVASFNDASTQEAIRLVKANAAVGTAKTLNGTGSVSIPNCSNPVGGPQGLEVGGGSDLWGTTLTRAEVNDPGFGILYDNDFRNTAVDGVSVTVHYEDNVHYTVTSSAGPGGSISPVGMQSVLSGTTAAFTVTPSPGHAISGVGGTCGGTLEQNLFTTSEVVASCTVVASFEALVRAATDLDGDGRSDILYRNTSSGQVFRLLMNGLAVDNGAMAYVEPNTAWKIVGDGDFNGDFVTDLLWRNEVTGAVFYMPFSATGLPSGGEVVVTEPNGAWKIVHTPDLDGDGRADILWWNSGTGQVYAMLMDGASIALQGFVYSEPNTAWKIVAVGDFAGNGKQNQLLWRNSITGQVWLMTVTVGAGFGQTGGLLYSEPNTAWKIVGAADFSGDGKTDILWRNDSNGWVYMMIMDGTTRSSEGLVYVEPDSAWKLVAFGDYDGNGRADLLWRNQSTGQVYMMLMSGLSIGSQGMAYVEGNLAWRVLGPLEYGSAAGVLP